MTTTTAPLRTRTGPSDRSPAAHGFGFWAIAYAFLVVMAYNAVPAPLYGIYQQRDGFSSFTITVIFAAYAVGVVISLFTVGHLSDWHGRRRLFAPALVLCMISAVVFLLWRDLPGLILARVLGGIAVGAVTATATAWLAELHSAARPDASAKRAQVVSTTANLGGIGLGPLVAGALAEWVGAPLTVPYVVSLVALGAALIAVTLSPETRERPDPRPRYRPQRVSVPRDAVARYLACGIGAAISFAVFGLFTSLAPTFLAGTLDHHSYALAGFTAFIVFAAAVVSQTAIAGRPTRSAMAGGIAGMVLGMAVLVVSVFLPSPLARAVPDRRRDHRRRRRRAVQGGRHLGRRDRPAGEPRRGARRDVPRRLHRPLAPRPRPRRDDPIPLPARQPRDLHRRAGDRDPRRHPAAAAAPSRLTPAGRRRSGAPGGIGTPGREMRDARGIGALGNRRAGRSGRREIRAPGDRGAGGAGSGRPGDPGAGGSASRCPNGGESTPDMGVDSP